MCMTTECRIDNAAGTARETREELMKALSTATAVESVIIQRLCADASDLHSRLMTLHQAMRASG